MYVRLCVFQGICVFVVCMCVCARASVDVFLGMHGCVKQGKDAKRKPKQIQLVALCQIDVCKVVA